MHQAELELRNPESHQGKLVHGTLQRHRLFSDANGRWLEFSVIDERGRTTRCRWPVRGKLGDALHHGRRRAVSGHSGLVIGEPDVLVVSVFREIGSVPGACALARGARFVHLVLLRKQRRAPRSEVPPAAMMKPATTRRPTTACVRQQAGHGKRRAFHVDLVPRYHPNISPH